MGAVQRSDRMSRKSVRTGHKPDARRAQQEHNDGKLSATHTDELAVIVKAWVRLPAVVRRAILGAVRTFE
jgi:hypothetical protein